MLRSRIQVGLISVVLLSAGCGVATPSPPIDPSPGAPSPAPALPSDEESALDELCDPQHDASFTNLAEELESLDETDDSQALSDVLERARANLGMLNLGPDGMSVRDSTVALMGDLAAGIDDPATRSATAIAAAQSLRGLEIEVCPPPEI